MTNFEATQALTLVPFIAWQDLLSGTNIIVTFPETSLYEESVLIANGLGTSLRTT